MIIRSDSPDTILPILEEKCSILNQNNSVSFELKLNPADPFSPVVRTSIHRVNGEESPCRIITWVHTTHAHIFPGLRATTRPLQKMVLNNLIEGINRIIFIANLEKHTMANRLH
jgi:hypothetical protein